MRDVLVRADRFDEPRLLAGAAMGAGTLGDEAREAELLARAITLARASGAVDALTLALLAIATAGVLAGRFDVVPQATEGVRLAREARLTGVAGLHDAILAWFAAARGAGDDCAEHVAAVRRATTDNALASSIAQWALGLLALGEGRAEEAAGRLGELAAGTAGATHPLVVLVSAADRVEACIRAGEHTQAQEAFAILDGFTRTDAPAWALGSAARCRGLLAGDNETAGQQLEHAVRLHAAANRPFDRARSELLLGEHLRRARRRVEARTQLRAAIATFEPLGARPWTERARMELRASGETARKRDPSTLAHLTPQEVQVARYVAEGMSNKEVAAQLFLSPRTIDSHLRSVFSKLGITSRTQLARHMA
jgi:DNA-binding CsgD family transcriptional regulator